MNIVLINQFFPPALAPTGRLLATVAEELLLRGHQVTVITSAAGYGEEAGGPTSFSSALRVIRVGLPEVHQKGLGRKLRSYLLFFLHAERSLAHLSTVPDVLLCMTTPPFCGQLGVRLKRKRGVPYVLWCMDLYPEALLAHGLMGRHNPLFTLLKTVARRERSRADRVIALGPDMAARLAASGASRVADIPVWSEWTVTPQARAGARALRRERGWAEDEIVLLYSGNMGRAHRMREFLALAEQVRGRSPRCRLVFSGAGPRRDVWAQQGKGLVEFMPPVPETETAAHLLAADIHLVSQQPEWTGVVVPSKFQAACALGRPVVFAGPAHSSVGTWLAESDAGWILPPGDRSALTRAAGELLDSQIRADKGRRAFRLFEKRFTRASQCAGMVDQIERPAKEHP